MLSANTLLLPALIFLIVGILVGVLVMTVIGGRRKESEPSESTEPGNLMVSEMPSLPEDRFESIAHLYREKQSGKLVTDIKGKVHLTHNTIPSEELRVLQEASDNWQAWLGLVAPAPAIPVMPQQQPDASTPVTLASAARNAPVEKPRAKTIVGQIEEILQELLPDSEYAGQNIHLGEEPNQGVVIWVGAQKFVGVDSVPDEGIRNLIQAAARRWEERGGTE